MAHKPQRFTVTQCAHRFCSKNVVNFYFKNTLTDSENRCILPLVRNAASDQAKSRPASREAAGRVGMPRAAGGTPESQVMSRVTSRATGADKRWAFSTEAATLDTSCSSWR